MLTCLVPVLFTFYIQCVPKFKKKSGAKELIQQNCRTYPGVGVYGSLCKVNHTHAHQDKSYHFAVLNLRLLYHIVTLYFITFYVSLQARFSSVTHHQCHNIMLKLDIPIGAYLYLRLLQSCKTQISLLSVCRGRTNRAL